MENVYCTERIWTAFLFALTPLLLTGCDSSESYDWVFQERCELTPLEIRLQPTGDYKLDFRNDARGPVRQIEVNKTGSDQDFLFLNGLGLISVYTRQMPDRIDKGEIATVEGIEDDWDSGSDTLDVSYSRSRDKFSCEVGT